MHATLLTLILVTGAGACGAKSCDTDSQFAAKSDASCDTAKGGSETSKGCDENSRAGGKDGDCDVCHGTDDGARNRHLARGGLMPQSCYGPAYGCYPGNDRRIQRYPAFHGTFYRNPYNYRNEFDYPWHAGLHEPTSLFSYNVVSETTTGAESSLPSSRDDNAAPPPPQKMSSRPGASSVVRPQRSLDR
jgi:hypothetical protein